MSDRIKFQQIAQTCLEVKNFFDTWLSVKPREGTWDKEKVPQMIISN